MIEIRMQIGKRGGGGGTGAQSIYCDVTAAKEIKRNIADEQ
jgi:hypothetical protein